MPKGPQVKETEESGYGHLVGKPSSPETGQGPTRILGRDSPLGLPRTRYESIAYTALETQKPEVAGFRMPVTAG